MIHSFHIFDRHCNCIYSRDFGSDHINKTNNSDASKLLFGIIYSLKNILSKLAGSDTNTNHLKSFSTSKFRIHFHETATNLKFVLVSDVDVDNLQPVLWELYSNHYVTHISMNYLSPVDFKTENDKINNGAFITLTDAYLKALAG